MIVHFKNMSYTLFYSYQNLWPKYLEQLHLLSKLGLSFHLRFRGFLPADCKQVRFLGLSITVSYIFIGHGNRDHATSSKRGRLELFTA